MSFLLTIESSTPHLSVALFKNEELVEEIYCAPDGRGHSEKLLPLIDKILSKNKIGLDDLNSLAVAVGPGSYTSLRVGLATIIGLASPRNLPIYPVSSLKALAMGCLSLHVAPVFKAGRGRIYAAVYKHVGARHLSADDLVVDTVPLQTMIPESVFQPDDFLSRIKLFKQDVTFVGPGVELLEQSRGVLQYAPTIVPRASNVGRLVFIDQIKSMPIDQIRLRYLQEPDFGKQPS